MRTTKVTELVFEGTIQQLSSKIRMYPNLEVLSVCSCGLEQLPSEIGNLKRLRVLNVSNNELTALPREIGKLKRLEVLNLDGNKLTALPPEIGKLTLRDFSCQSNPLPDKVLELKDPSGLKVLNIKKPKKLIRYLLSSNESVRNLAEHRLKELYSK